MLGMHRSGTSAITKGLELLGVELGNNLMPAAKGNNERGFFEDLDIHNFNQRLISEALDNDWDRLEPLQLDRLGAEHRAAAKRLLQEKLPERRPFAFKDPRVSLLQPLWETVFDSLAIDHRYLICVRNPLSVAGSLFKRDRLHPLKAQLLWCHYMLAALRHTQGKHRVFVDFDRLFEAPVNELERIATAFELPLPDREAADVRAYATDFLAPALRHNHSHAEQLEDPRQALALTRDLFRLLKRQADGRCADEIDDGQLRELESRYEGLLPIRQDLDRIYSDRDGLEKHLLMISNDHFNLLENAEGLSRPVSLDAWREYYTRELRRDLIQARRDEAHQRQLLQHECWRLEDQLKIAQAQNQGTQLELQRIYASNSWRLTEALRALRRALVTTPLKLLRGEVKLGSGKPRAADLDPLGYETDAETSR